MDLDPITKLSRRINVTKGQREAIAKQIEKDNNDVQNITEKLDKLRADLESKKQSAGEREKKSAHIEKLITESEITIKKIIETSIILEKALDQEPK